MKKFFVLFTILSFLALENFILFAADEKDADNKIMRKSTFTESGNFIHSTSYPFPFDRVSNPAGQAAVSTGYYFVDSDDEAPDYWRPNPEIIDTTYETSLWKRILAGPRIVDKSYWTQNPGEGLRFFRNPAVPANGDFWSGATDSTDDAIAGPIPIGFNFFFNGLRYDSFYVSTNGIIALTNRRYYYNASGNRKVHFQDCYDTMSADWFARGRNGDGLNDTTPDDYGYTYSVCGGNPLDPLGGIRQRGGALDAGDLLKYRTAVIAPFFGDMHLSQFNPKTNLPQDWGRVYYKRNTDNNKLIIYYISISPHRALNTTIGTFDGGSNLRPSADWREQSNYIAANAQIVLNALDSSVQIIYERFDGVIVLNQRGVPANIVFRYNTTVGVSGYARHKNYGQPNYDPAIVWAGEYPQTTHYLNKFDNPNVTFPHNYLAIKFKQWKNLLRVVDVQYRVRKLDPNANLEFTDTVPSSKVNDYELLAGEERIGAIQPVAIIQNLTNNIQGPTGVNYQPQQLIFRAVCRIVNTASNRIVYNRLVPIDSTCLALPDNLSYNCTGDTNSKVRYCSVNLNKGDYTATRIAFPGINRYNGIPPYGFVQVFFKPFEPNEFVNNHIGRMKISIIADPTNPVTNEILGDQWPFDDTASVRIFIMKRLDDFYDDFSEFHLVDRVPMPSTLKWVNIGAEISSGEEISNNPMPPRGEYGATNNIDFNFAEPDYSTYLLQSPVVRMNRLTLNRQEPLPPSKGDELRSFPIDLRGRFRTMMSVSFQRTVKQEDWPRGWSDQQLIGPEPRTVVNANPFMQWTQYPYAASSPAEYDEKDPRSWESIAIEIMSPSPDGVHNITNVEDSRWRIHPRRKGAKPVTNMAAYALFGAGGCIKGFLETDYDSALSVPSGKSLDGLRPDIYDDGVDFEYKKAYVAIPDTFIKAMNEGAKNFRFRIKVYANNDKKCATCIPDDDDPFFVDNVALLFPCECTDIEISSVRALWPYTTVPASQAIKIPLRVRVSNNTSIDAPGFLIKVIIFKEGQNRSSYCRIEQLPFLHPGQSVEMAMPFWDAYRYSGAGKYKIYGVVIVPGGDLNPNNDITFTNITLNFSDVIAYDPIQNPRNDVPDNAFTGMYGRGLNLLAFAEGGRGSVLGPSGNYDENSYGAGALGGSYSGQIAMKFQLFQADTIIGYKAWFSMLNGALDDIALSIYTDNGQPNKLVPGSLIYRMRCLDEERNEPFFDEYVAYKLPKPLVLPAGTYWCAVAELGETGFELGASKSRCGMRTTSIYVPPPLLDAVGAVGGNGYSLMIDKSLRKMNPSGNLVNNNLFAVENTRNSGNWLPFMPTSGNPAYAHLHHFGITPADGQTATLSRGTWIPMLRPYLGKRPSVEAAYNDCSYDPVEIAYFDGQIREKGIDLFWGTSSELNNAGFYVERKLGRGDDIWTRLDFIKGNGTSRDFHQYCYSDEDVAPATSYQYRIRQIDLDGVMACETNSKIITLTTYADDELVLEQNSPNPFSGSTQIRFRLQDNSESSLAVLDLFGNIVRILNADKEAGWHSVFWDGKDNNNAPVSNGIYILRLTFGNEIKTIKMTVVR